MSTMSSEPQSIFDDEYLTKPKGLLNSNNNCYVNCVLQILFQMKGVTKLLLTSKSDIKEVIPETLKTLYYKYRFGKENFLDSAHFCEELSELSGLPFKLNEQHDAGELLIVLLDKFQSLSEMDHVSLFSFRITMEQCLHCENESNYESDQGIILFLPMRTSNNIDSVSLDFLLESYFNCHGDEPLICSNCHEQKTNKRFLDESPIYLIIQITRYDEQLQKNRRDVDIPLHLNLGQYARLMSNKQLYDYTLHSQIHHSGESIHQGHYTVDVILENECYSIDGLHMEISRLRDSYVKSTSYIICYKRNVDKINTTIVESEASQHSSVFGEKILNEKSSNNKKVMMKKNSETSVENCEEAQEPSGRLPLQRINHSTGELVSLNITLIGYKKQPEKLASVIDLIYKNGGVLNELEENPFDHENSMVICPPDYRNYIIERCYYANFLDRSIQVGKVVEPLSAEKCPLRLAKHDVRNILGVFKIEELSEFCILQQNETVFPKNRENDSKIREKFPLRQFLDSKAKIISWHIVLVGFEEHNMEKAELAALILASGGTLSQLQENPFDTRYAMIICPEDYCNTIIDECYYARFLRRCITSGEIVQPNPDEKCSLRLPSRDPRNFFGVQEIEYMKEKLHANQISHLVGILHRLKKKRQESSDKHESSLKQINTSKDTSPSEPSFPENQSLSRNQPVPKHRKTDGIDHSSEEKCHAKCKLLKPKGKQEKSSREKLRQDLELKEKKTASVLSAPEGIDNAGRASNHAEMEGDENDRPMQSKIRGKQLDLTEVSLFVKWLMSSGRLSDSLNNRKYPDLLSSFLISTKHRFSITSLKDSSTLYQHIRRTLRRKIFLDSHPYSLDTNEVKILQDFFNKDRNKEN